MPQDKKILTLCFIVEPPKILLAMKKRGFGAGRWNGLGGKVAADETIEAAARRELHEEIGVTAQKMTQQGIIEFEWQNKPGILQVHVFRVDRYTGTPAESEEMRPQWFDIDAIPYDDMWADDRHWLPLFIAGKKLEGYFLFDDADQILDQRLVEV